MVYSVKKKMFETHENTAESTAILTKSVMSWTCLACLASEHIMSWANLFLLFSG